MLHYKSLFVREGTNKVLDNENEGVRATLPAPVTGCVTPLAFAIRERLGGHFSFKSRGSKVIWSEAPESIIQLDESCLEQNKPQPVLP